ncbi:MAG: hypothetical protein EOP43_07155 [Sphingobacteriaceae bacterium]|nr:MAG: hypothetical protein EOP43_07155 [Sphingobacteriaceae bacterium]
MTKLIIEIPEEELEVVSEIVRNKGGRILVNSFETELNGSIWNTLNQQQKQEVLMAYEESENEENLVDAKAVFRNLK